MHAHIDDLDFLLPAWLQVGTCGELALNLLSRRAPSILPGQNSRVLQAWLVWYLLYVYLHVLWCVCIRYHMHLHTCMMHNICTMYVCICVYIYTYYDIWFDIWYEPWPGVEVFMVKDNSWALEDLTGGSWQWGDGLTVLPSHDKKSLLSPKILSPPKDRRVWKPSPIYQSLSVYHVGNTGSPTQIWLNFERFGLPHYAAVLAGTALRLNISRDLLRL
jgi:hypothetical protein